MSKTEKVKILPPGLRGHPKDYSQGVLEELPNSGENANKMIDCIKQKRKGEKAVGKVIEAFQRCGRSKGLLMFILSNFKYNRYLSTAERKTGTVTMVDGDYDILIVCKQFGILFVQVKGCDTDTSNKTKKDALRKAFDQLIRDQMVFLESNRDLNFINHQFPTWGLVAMPFIESQALEELPLCNAHKKLVLTKESLESNTLGQVQLNEKGSFQTVEDFQALCARYVCLSGPIQSLPKAITRASGTFKKLVLTPEQHTILKNKNQFQVIKGDFGTGKTLLLCYKARETLAEIGDKTVVFVVCADLDKYSMLHIKIGDSPLIKFIEHFLKNKGETIGNSKFEVFTLGNLYQQRNEHKSDKRIEVTEGLFLSLIEMKMSPNVNLFIDELPLQLFEKCENNLISLARSNNANLVWAAIAAQSSYGNVMQTQSSNTDSIRERFPCEGLSYNMRNSQSILKLMKYISKYTNENCDIESNSGTAVEGPIPLLVHMEKCSCPDKAQKERSIFCSCLEKRIAKVLEYVLNKLKISVNDKDQIIYVVQHIYNDGFGSSILQKLMSTFQHVFTALGLDPSKFQWLTLANKSDQHYDYPYNHNAIKMVDWGTFIGCESTVVVNFDFFAMWQWLPENKVGNGSIMTLSRCTTQYVHIVLPGDEPQTFIEQHIDMYKSYVDKHRNEPCDDPRHHQSLKELEDFAKDMDTFRQHKGELLHKLLREGLLLEEKVPLDQGSSQSKESVP
ncbi:hypothetical protein HOLleu_26132 [Holothuria leucospilota]|uniref:Uncharacterized protein n=1 Tax=Holothuria leucospilota TaxID=206669 RepID=A0A9Q1BTU9_HOLLE|nr:hypothetical protein HOLleu_26132 [Holothuria leucospilota]